MGVVKRAWRGTLKLKADAPGQYDKQTAAFGCAYVVLLGQALSRAEEAAPSQVRAHPAAAARRPEL